MLGETEFYLKKFLDCIMRREAVSNKYPINLEHALDRLKHYHNYLATIKK